MDLDLLQARRNLGLEPVKEKPKRAITRGLMVTLTVRRGNGPESRFIHATNTLSRLVAELEAKAAARKLGLTPWSVTGTFLPDEETYQRYKDSIDRIC